MSRDEIERQIAAGDIDTVIVAFTDMQGRLMGKRVSAAFFVNEVAEGGAECCNYLFAVDVDMNTVKGYAMSGWDTGYGDMLMKPDLTTLRRIPWLPGSALVLADLVWHDGSPIEPAPRRVLRRQLERLRERGLDAFVATELEFMVFDDTYREAWAAEGVAAGRAVVIRTFGSAPRSTCRTAASADARSRVRSMLISIPSAGSTGRARRSSSPASSACPAPRAWRHRQARG